MVACRKTTRLLAEWPIQFKLRSWATLSVLIFSQVVKPYRRKNREPFSNDSYSTVIITFSAQKNKFLTYFWCYHHQVSDFFSNSKFFFLEVDFTFSPEIITILSLFLLFQIPGIFLVMDHNLWSEKSTKITRNTLSQKKMIFSFHQ